MVAVATPAAGQQCLCGIYEQWERRKPGACSSAAYVAHPQIPQSDTACRVAWRCDDACTVTIMIHHRPAVRWMPGRRSFILHQSTHSESHTTATLGQQYSCCPVACRAKLGHGAAVQCAHWTTVETVCDMHIALIHGHCAPCFPSGNDTLVRRRFHSSSPNPLRGHAGQSQPPKHTWGPLEVWAGPGIMMLTKRPPSVPRATHR